MKQTDRISLRRIRSALAGALTLAASSSVVGCNGEKIQSASAHCDSEAQSLRSQKKSATDVEFMCKQCCMGDLLVSKVDKGTGGIVGDKCVCRVE